MLSGLSLNESEGLVEHGGRLQHKGLGGDEGC